MTRRQPTALRWTTASRFEAAKPLHVTGAEWARTPAEAVQKADAVVRKVFGSKEIAQFVRRPDGFLPTSRKGKRWIDLTASSAKLMREQPAESSAKGGAADGFVLQHDVRTIFAGHYAPFTGVALCLKGLAVSRVSSRRS